MKKIFIFLILIVLLSFTVSAVQNRTMTLWLGCSNDNGETPYKMEFNSSIHGRIIISPEFTNVGKSFGTSWWERVNISLQEDTYHNISIHTYSGTTSMCDIMIFACNESAQFVSTFAATDYDITYSSNDTTDCVFVRELGDYTSRVTVGWQPGPADYVLDSDDELGINGDNIVASYEDSNTWWYDVYIPSSIVPVPEPTFEQPTPFNNSRNNTIPTINVSCSLNGNITLWFDNNTIPITKVIDNQPSHANWTPLFLSNNKHNYMASCDLGVNSSIRMFEYDGTAPSITWTIPLSNNLSTAVVNLTYNFDINLNDPDLDSYEFILADPKGNQQGKWNDTGIGVSSYNFIESFVLNMTGNWTIKAKATDSHTNFKIEEWEYSISDKLIKFEFPKIKNWEYIIPNVSIEYTGYYPLLSISTDKKTDRYTFKFRYDLKNVAIDEIQHSYRVRCDGARPIKNSGYMGHIVCDSTLKWVDFSNPYVNKFEIYTCGNDCYDVNLYTDVVDVLEFNSIGGLNINEEHKNIVVINATIVIPDTPFLTIGECPADDLTSVVLFIGIFLIITALIIMNIMLLKIPILNLLVGLSYMFFFGSFLGCHLFIGLTGIIISVVIMATSVISKF